MSLDVGDRDRYYDSADLIFCSEFGAISRGIYSQFRSESNKDPMDKLTQKLAPLALQLLDEIPELSTEEAALLVANAEAAQLVFQQRDRILEALQESRTESTRSLAITTVGPLDPEILAFVDAIEPKGACYCEPKEECH